MSGSSPLARACGARIDGCANRDSLDARGSEK